MPDNKISQMSKKLPCGSLVKKSAIIEVVGQYFIVMVFLLTRSLMQKYLMFSLLVRFLDDGDPLISNLIVYSLSWKKDCLLKDSLARREKMDWSYYWKRITNSN